MATNKIGILNRFENRMNKIKLKNLIYFYLIFSLILMVGISISVLVFYNIFMVIGDNLINFFQDLSKFIFGGL